MAQSGHPKMSAWLSAFGAKRTCAATRAERKSGIRTLPTPDSAARRLGFEMVLDGAIELADRGGEDGILRHQGPQSREHRLAQGRIIDAEHASLAHDGAPGHDQLVYMARGRPCEQQI